MTTPSTARRTSWLALAALVAVLLVLAAWRPLALPDEGRYAEIGRWMWQSGDALAPRLNGLPFFHKPPLLHWLQAGSFAVWGVHPWSARLVPALHAALMLLGLYLSVRHAEGELRARQAMLILGSSLGLLMGGQYVNHDMLVAAWISTAIWCMGAAFLRERADGRPDTPLALAGFAACALGVLSKGLIGIVLPGLVIVCWLLYTGQLRRLLLLPWLRGLGVFCALALPWFVLGQRQYPELFNYLIIGQHFARYTGQTFNNQWPLWFYPLVLLALLFPWSLLMGAWLRPKVLRAALTQPRRDPAARWSSLLWIWLLAILLFFSLPRSKIVGYIFPVLPPMAALIAQAWGRWSAGARTKAAVFAGLLALSLVLTVLANAAAGRHTLQHASRDVGLLLRCAAQPGEQVYTSGDYPYDLPFYARLPQAMVVVQDWAEARRNSGDNWRRELFEAADFEPATGQALLQGPEALQQAASGSWLVTPNDFPAPATGAWRKVHQGQAWSLWRQAASVAEGPPAAQQERLARCQQQGQH